jgi:hypothetical protein
MPRKRAIRSVSELGERLRKTQLKQMSAFQEAISRPKVARLAASRVSLYITDMQSAPVAERRSLLRAMPSYEMLVERADHELRPHRAKFARKTCAERARKARYRIGELTCQGLTLPPGVEPVRLPLTIDGFIEEFISKSKRIRPQARHLWNDLLEALKTIASSVTDDRDGRNPRNDAYYVAIEGESERITFGQFQKIISKVRRSRKALG